MASDQAVGIASLALAAPPILEPLLHCVQYIQQVVTRYREVDDTHDKNLLQLDTHLYLVQQFAGFLEENFASLDNETRSLCKRLVAVLETCLIKLVSVLSSLTDASGNIKKLDYAVRGRDIIAQLHSQLVAWEGSLNSVLFSFFLCNRRSPPSSKIAGRNSVRPTRWERTAELLRQCLSVEPSSTLRLDASLVETANFVPIPYSLAMWRESPSPCLLETHVSTANEEDVRDVAAFLHKSDMNVVNVFKCQGFHGHKLLFELPSPPSRPVSLQNILVDAYDKPSTHDLASRLALMKKIASCIFFVHTANHVHKSVRTSNILLLSSSLPSYLGEPYLVGFDLSRKSQQASGYTRSTHWWDAFYLPPDRQGDVNRAYTFLDDVYSFGVVLLELCLWRSFARRRKSSKPPHGMKWMRGSEMMDITSSPPSPLGPEALRRKFIQLAKERVPILMGSTMSELIVSCLSCLDNGCAFGDRKELEDGDGIVMGIAYIKQVIIRLESISL
ncbi:hypothetical protein B0T10DRAFT_554015 [Thelonectria olida]|uniref:Protein kinase domain-containing protein n=1 Tax=Thelonectria olida TaxID=1576542 RepID=A0A9P8VPD2_9HYPO|nr:hypothetical protein B0T10DRAFT_554015 [Thelonectria olida]